MKKRKICRCHLTSHRKPKCSSISKEKRLGNLNYTFGNMYSHKPYGVFFADVYLSYGQVLIYVCLCNLWKYTTFHCNSPTPPPKIRERKKINTIEQASSRLKAFIFMIFSSNTLKLPFHYSNSLTLSPQTHANSQESSFASTFILEIWRTPDHRQSRWISHMHANPGRGEAKKRIEA